MPRIAPVEPAEADGSNREIFEQFLKERGNIPNMMRTMGLRPEHMRTMVAHMRVVMRSGTVPAILKEFIAVRVSRLNGCTYCLASHTALARKLGADERQIATLLDVSGPGEAAVGGFPEECIGTAPTQLPAAHNAGPDDPFSPAERAALLFAEQMTTGTGQVPGWAFARLSEFFDPAEIVEIAAVAGLFAYFNRFNNALEVEVTR